MTGALVAGLLAGYAIAIPVGAVAAYLVSLSARTSLRVGSAAALGVASADGVYAAIAVSAGATIGPLVTPAADVLRWVAASVLLVIAAYTVITTWRRHTRPPMSLAPCDTTAPTGTRSDRWQMDRAGWAYLGSLGLTLLNPMTIVYFAALVVGGRSAVTVSPAGQVLFVVAAFAASASWQLMLAIVGSLLGRLLTGPGQLLTAAVSSLVITALALRMVMPI